MSSIRVTSNRVISIRKIEANRANARKSTGPKTSAGKARSSRNALRHGCESPALWGGGHTPEVEALARTMAGRDSSCERFARACRIAAAQLDLAQIRLLKRDLQEAANFGGTFDGQDGADHKSPDWKFLARISRIERYEQRARARRRRAIREFHTPAPDQTAAKNFTERSQRENSQ